MIAYAFKLQIFRKQQGLSQWTTLHQLFCYYPRHRSSRSARDGSGCSKLVCYLKPAHCLISSFCFVQRKESCCISHTKGQGWQPGIEHRTHLKCRSQQGSGRASIHYRHHCSQLYDHQLFLPLTENAWDVITGDDIKQALSREATNSSGDAIRGDNVDPDTIENMNDLIVTFIQQPLFCPQFSEHDHVHFQKQAWLLLYKSLCKFIPISGIDFLLAVRACFTFIKLNIFSIL